MDSEFASQLVGQIRAQKDKINDLVARIQKLRQTEALILQERRKAQESEAAAARIRTIARTALSILEKPPCSRLMFDNRRSKEFDARMGEYPTRTVNIADVVDLGERLVDPVP